ncbi:hypothetical protein DFJ74DRAFT_688787 [Hyaloraphidium curvatum]|nr:hypothetical protein DFJ74DRAFT_688787 [Hyaloraphidium curvatum]
MKPEDGHRKSKGRRRRIVGVPWTLVGLYAAFIVVSRALGSAATDATPDGLPMPRNASSETPFADPTLEIVPSNSSLLLEGRWLVFISAPWCPFSARFEKRWPAIVQSLVSERAANTTEANTTSVGSPSLTDSGTGTPQPTPVTAADLQSVVPAMTDDIEAAASPSVATVVDTASQKRRSRSRGPLRFARIDAVRNAELAAQLEVKAYPTVKLLQDGNIWTLSNITLDAESVLYFAREGWRIAPFYNRMPRKPSWSYVQQLKLWNWLGEQKARMGVRLTLLLPMLMGFVVSLAAYSANLLGVYRSVFGKFAMFERVVADILGIVGDFEEDLPELAEGPAPAPNHGERAQADLLPDRGAGDDHGLAHDEGLRRRHPLAEDNDELGDA